VDTEQCGINQSCICSAFCSSWSQLRGKAQNPTSSPVHAPKWIQNSVESILHMLFAIMVTAARKLRIQRHLPPKILHAHNHTLSKESKTLTMQPRNIDLRTLEEVTPLTNPFSFPFPPPLIGTKRNRSFVTETRAHVIQKLELPELPDVCYPDDSPPIVNLVKRRRQTQEYCPKQCSKKMRLEPESHLPKLSAQWSTDSPEANTWSISSRGVLTFPRR
jgi:hypothetical protein